MSKKLLLLLPIFLLISCGESSDSSSGSPIAIIDEPITQIEEPIEIEEVVETVAALITFEPLTSTNISLPSNQIRVIKYLVTNKSGSEKSYVLAPQAGFKVINDDANVCPTPFILQQDEFCVLTFEIIGSEISENIISGPSVCVEEDSSNCLSPVEADSLVVTIVAPETTSSTSRSPAAKPLFSLEALTGNLINLPRNEIAVVKYLIKSNAKTILENIALKPIAGVRQIQDEESASCTYPFTLVHKEKCILSLEIRGSVMDGQIMNGPLLCVQGNPNLCYSSDESSKLMITRID